MPRRRRFEQIRYGPGFRAVLDDAPANIREGLDDLRGPLLENPLPRQSLLGVRELKDSQGNSCSRSFRQDLRTTGGRP